MKKTTIKIVKTRIFGRAFFTEYFTDIGFDFVGITKAGGIIEEQRRRGGANKILTRMTNYVILCFFSNFFQEKIYDKVVKMRIFGRLFY